MATLKRIKANVLLKVGEAIKRAKAIVSELEKLELEVSMIDESSFEDDIHILSEIRKHSEDPKSKLEESVKQLLINSNKPFTVFSLYTSVDQIYKGKNIERPLFKTVLDLVYKLEHEGMIKVKSGNINIVKNA